MTAVTASPPAGVVASHQVQVSPKPAVVLKGTSADMRVQLVELAAEAVNSQLLKIFSTEIEAMKKEFDGKGKKIPEGAEAYTIKSKASSATILMRPAHLIATHAKATLAEDVKALSAPQANCYNAILAKCIDKINKIDKYFFLGLNLMAVEPAIQSDNDFRKSKLLCSKVLAVALTCKDDKLKLFT